MLQETINELLHGRRATVAYVTAKVQLSLIICTVSPVPMLFIRGRGRGNFGYELDVLLLCALVASYVAFVLSLFVPHLSLWCPGRLCFMIDISWVSSHIFMLRG